MGNTIYQLDQSRAPFLGGLIGYSREGIIPFHTPGHKQGRVLDCELREALGDRPFLLDVSDEIYAPDKANDAYAVLSDAEALAADAFGAKRSFFLHNGTTAGIQAMLLASSWHYERTRGRRLAKQPGEIVLPRSVHRSVFGGLILTGLTPRFVEETWDRDWMIPLPPTPEAWGTAVAESPDPIAFLDTYPSYYGIGGDLGKIAQLAHEGDKFLLVDEAHGAHFRFHPGFPPTALSVGASASAQSAHKTLSVLTQASLLHTGDERLMMLMPAALGLLQSTSPSFLLYAALDAGRRQMALRGRVLWDKTLALCQAVRAEINQISGLHCLADEALQMPGAAVWDPTKLLIKVDGLGLSGAQAEAILRQYGVQVELAGLNHVLVLFAVGDGPAQASSLVKACERLAGTHKGATGARATTLTMPAGGEMMISPRQAVLAPRRQIPFIASQGAIAAEMITPYPPGIPLLVPGEKITALSIGCLEDYLRHDIVIQGWANLARRTIWVVDGY